MPKTALFMMGLTALFLGPAADSNAAAPEQRPFSVTPTGTLLPELPARKSRQTFGPEYIGPWHQEINAESERAKIIDDAFLRSQLPPSSVPAPPAPPLSNPRRSMPKLPKVRTANAVEDLPSIMGRVSYESEQLAAAPPQMTYQVAQTARPLQAADRTSHRALPLLRSSSNSASSGTRSSWMVARDAKPDGQLLPTGPATHQRSTPRSRNHRQNSQRHATVQYAAPYEAHVAHAPSNVQLGPSPCGCGHCRHTCGSTAEPPGVSMNAYMDQQIQNGQQAQLVMYHYDFGPGNEATQLNEAGLRKLTRLVPMLESTAGPLVVEAIYGRPDLGEARRNSVLQALANYTSIGFADSQIVVQPTSQYGIRGADADVINRNELQTLQSRGVSFTGSGRGSAQGVSPTNQTTTGTSR